MSNTGIPWERMVRKMYERFGYVVIRSAGSLGPVDLIAWSEEDVHLVQCKKETKGDAYRGDIEKLRAVKVPKEGNWKKLLWVKRKYGLSAGMWMVTEDGCTRSEVPYRVVKGAKD